MEFQRTVTTKHTVDVESNVFPRRSNQKPSALYQNTHGTRYGCGARIIHVSYDVRVKSDACVTPFVHKHHVHARLNLCLSPSTELLSGFKATLETLEHMNQRYM